MTHPAYLLRNPMAKREAWADLLALQAGAQRLSTPCGDGELVWHRWGEGAPLVLLHGGSGSWTHWLRNIAPLVAAGHQVLAPDLPGFGDSDPPPEGHDADVMPHWKSVLFPGSSSPVVEEMEEERWG